MFIYNFQKKNPHFKTIYQKFTISNQPSKIYLSNHLPKFHISLEFPKITHFETIYQNLLFHRYLSKIPHFKSISNKLVQSFNTSYSFKTTPGSCVEDNQQDTSKKITYQSCKAQSYVIMTRHVHSAKYLKTNPSKYYFRDQHNLHIEITKQQGT